MSDGQKFTCSCGFTWLRGQSGSHECGPYYLNRIAELERQNAQMAQALDHVIDCWACEGLLTDGVVFNAQAALAQAKTEGA